jgi:FkbM family methyltransferase
MTVSSIESGVVNSGVEIEAFGTFNPPSFVSLLIRLCHFGFPFRGVFRKFTRWIATRHSPTCDIELDGLKFRCRIGDNATENGLVLKGRNNSKIWHIASILDHLAAGGVFVDVGANCGLYSLYAARKVGPTGRVLAIEPIEEMASRLRYNISLNHAGNVVEVVPAAVGPENGTATIHVWGGNYGQTCMASVENSRTIEVEVRTLKSIVEASEVDRIDALKIDVEGFEDKALIPFFETAPKALWPRAIFMEVSSAYRWRDDCVATLKKLGYAEIGRDRSNIVLANQASRRVLSTA